MFKLLSLDSKTKIKVALVKKTKNKQLKFVIFDITKVINNHKYMIEDDLKRKLPWTDNTWDLCLRQQQSVNGVNIPFGLSHPLSLK